VQPPVVAQLDTGRRPGCSRKLVTTAGNSSGALDLGHGQVKANRRPLCTHGKTNHARREWDQLNLARCSWALSPAQRTERKSKNGLDSMIPDVPNRRKINRREHLKTKINCLHWPVVNELLTRADGHKRRNLAGTYCAHARNQVEASTSTVFAWGDPEIIENLNQAKIFLNEQNNRWRKCSDPKKETCERHK
jgi:hypothetical protein